MREVANWAQITQKNLEMSQEVVGGATKTKAGVEGQGGSGSKEAGARARSPLHGREGSLIITT